MFIITPPTPVVSGQEFKATIPSAYDCVGYEIINDSPLAFNLGLPHGSFNYMAPQTTKFFVDDDCRGTSITVNPITVLSGVPAGLSSNIIIVGFERGDNFSEYDAMNISKLVYVANTLTVNWV